ncbi:MAG: hypothetical protein WC026_17125 [Hyphomicrobium sp.]|uniref:hypothetical protein n=1 Tax=Hyphomicrobium sp. TaxID=82 RepID=UPI003562815A
MTQIDELVKSLRVDVWALDEDEWCDTASRAADALEAQSAELARLRERNAELIKSYDLAMSRSNAWRDRAEKAETRNAELERESREYEGTIIHFEAAIERNAELEKERDSDKLMVDFLADTARIASIEAIVRELREALTTMRDAVQQWCDAVDRDSSWDGWDHHFKAVKWELLPATNAALASSESVVKSEGETP